LLDDGLRAGIAGPLFDGLADISYVHDTFAGDKARRW
jgi:hypothetical protein